MNEQSGSKETALDELAAVVSTEPGTVVTCGIEGGTVSAEALGGVRLRLQCHGISRDAAAAIALDLLGSSALIDEGDGGLSAEN
jgi:hypothetical protein